MKTYRAISNLLRDYGHESTDVRDTRLRGACDADVAAYAKEHGLCLLTGDLDFADIRNYSPTEFNGLLVLHLPVNATSSVILKLLESFLRRGELVAQLQGKLAIVERGRVRVRKD